MSERTVGKCSECGGRVTMPVGMWSGVNPPEPHCSNCGAGPRLPVVPMEGGQRPQQPKTSPRPASNGSSADAASEIAEDERRVLISLDELRRLLAERDAARLISRSNADEVLRWVSEAECHSHNHDVALDQRDAALADARKLADAIRWALGEGDSDFGEVVPHANEGRYWWRSELRKRAGDALKAHGAEDAAPTSNDG